MQKEIIIQNSHNNIMNTYKKILLILVLVLITTIITIPFKKNITITSIYKDSKFVIDTSSSPKEIMSNNYLYINNIRCKYIVDYVLEKQIILQINYPLQNFSENETIKLVLPIEEKPIIKYLYDYIRRTKW